MKFVNPALLLLFFWSPFFGFGQNVRDLNQATRDNASRSSSSSSSISESSNLNSSESDDLSGCGAALEGLVYFFVAIGKGLEALVFEEKRLAVINKTENRLFALEANAAGGIGFRPFTKIQPQIRLHLGWISFDYKHNLLYDNSGGFQSREFLTWLNFVNGKNFKLRTGIGALHFNTTRENFLLLGLGFEILPNNAPIRIEAWTNLNPINEGTFKRQRQEVGCRMHYEFWEKVFW